ncbi:hypothetical protein [Natronospora cellulosivora (SeqCode)]
MDKEDYHQLLKKLKEIAFKHTMIKIDNNDYTHETFIFKEVENDKPYKIKENQLP